jgi:hypothetical protein
MDEICADEGAVQPGSLSDEIELARLAALSPACRG